MTTVILPLACTALLVLWMWASAKSSNAKTERFYRAHPDLARARNEHLGRDDANAQPPS